LGDAVVSLPSFRLVARAFPQAERWVCTHFPKAGKAAPLAAIFEGMGLFHFCLEYPCGMSNARALVKLRKQIRELRFGTLVYMVPRQTFAGVLRDAVFFTSCGVPKRIGLPFRRCDRQHQWREELGRYESEGERLARCLAALGDPQLGANANWSLGDLATERGVVDLLLVSAFGEAPFIVCNIGGKGEVKDWGQEKWLTLFRKAAGRYSQIGLAMIGAAEEGKRAEELCREWLGPTLNLSGKLTPRESAAVLEKASLFLGHDSGPMHLAAAVGTPCVAIFSAREKPGVWFPRGDRHRILYHQTECFGCKLDVCHRYAAKCIRSISVEEVETALDAFLSHCFQDADFRTPA
jgi:heptosyltransferase-3